MKQNQVLTPRTSGRFLGTVKKRSHPRRDRAYRSAAGWSQRSPHRNRPQLRGSVRSGFEQDWRNKQTKQRKKQRKKERKKHQSTKLLGLQIYVNLGVLGNNVNMCWCTRRGTGGSKVHKKSPVKALEGLFGHHGGRLAWTIWFEDFSAK